MRSVYDGRDPGLRVRQKKKLAQRRKDAKSRNESRSLTPQRCVTPVYDGAWAGHGRGNLQQMPKANFEAMLAVVLSSSVARLP